MRLQSVSYFKSYEKLVSRKSCIRPGPVHPTNGASSVSCLDSWKCNNKGQTRPPGVADKNQSILQLCEPGYSSDCRSKPSCRTTCCPFTSRLEFKLRGVRMVLHRDVTTTSTSNHQETLIDSWHNLELFTLPQYISNFTQIFITWDGKLEKGYQTNADLPHIGEATILLAHRSRFKLKVIISLDCSFYRVKDTQRPDN